LHFDYAVYLVQALKRDGLICIVDVAKSVAYTCSFRLFGCAMCMICLLKWCWSFPACMYLNGVRWWGTDIRVTPSTAKQVKMARKGVEVGIRG